MYKFIPLDSSDYLKKILIKINMATNERKAEIKFNTEQTTKLE